MSLVVEVVGTPAPQGSKRGFHNKVTGRVQMVESSKKVAPWRQDVVAAVLNTIHEHGWTVPAHAVTVDITFYLPRPRSHFRTGRNANLLRDDAPDFVDKKPDIDKLARATLDALKTSGAIKDDAQVARLVTEKRYSSGRIGALIMINPLNAVAASGALPLQDPATVSDSEGAPSALVTNGAASVQDALL